MTSLIGKEVVITACSLAGQSVMVGAQEVMVIRSVL